MTTLTTARLTLVPFAEEHLDGLNAVNADPQVMRYFRDGPETREQTAAAIERVKARWHEFGYSWWAFIERDSGLIVGAGCLQHLRRGDEPLPDRRNPLEVGWRLRADRWHRGLATEAAAGIADFAFGPVGAQELYAVCNPANLPSEKVMQRLGMQACGLQAWYGAPMTTYRLAKAQWLGSPWRSTRAE